MIKLSDFSRLVYLIYQSPLEPEATDELLEEIKHVFDADYVWMSVSSFDVDTYKMCAPLRDRLLETTTSAGVFLYGFDAFDGIDANQSRSLAMLDESDAVRAYRQHTLEPLSVADVLALNIAEDELINVKLRIARSVASGRPAVFDLELNRTLDELAVHFIQALRYQDQFSTNRVERNVFADAMNNLLMGAIVLDSKGKVIATNRVAREMIAQYDAFSVRREGFRLSDKILQQKLVNTINQVGKHLAVSGQISADPRKVLSRVINVPVSAEYSIGIVVHPLRSEDAASKASVALFLRSPEESLTISTDALGELFDLTASEARVAIEVVNGLTVEEIADVLGVSKNTVKTHLKATFEKTGVKRQQALIKLILSSVAHVVSVTNQLGKNSDNGYH